MCEGWPTASEKYSLLAGEIIMKSSISNVAIKWGTYYTNMRKGIHIPTEDCESYSFYNYFLYIQILNSDTIAINIRVTVDSIE